ncbi:transglutaminase family protein [Nanoarchaeota archaeon]
MKRIVLVLMLVLMCTSVVGVDYYNRDSLDVNLRISSGFELVPTSRYYETDLVKVWLLYYPRDDLQQQVISLETGPEATEKTKSYFYKWEEPDDLENDFYLEADISTNDNVAQVRSKVDYPISDVPEEVEEFLEATDNIDSDDEAIIDLASELAEGEDDLFKVVFKLADWTEENIEYNVNTLTEDVSQRASWVLENREGVCDEMTSLFIAMCRALGIPARFISGVAYSDVFEDPWQSHGWAEVYFPDYGWVPFDPTYGEFGFLDATHIKLNEAEDAEEAATMVEWIGWNVDLVLDEIDFDVDVNGIGNEAADDIDLDIEIYKDEVDFGSSNLVTVEVENLRPYYLATKLTLSSTEEIRVGDQTQNVLLKPREKKKVFWPVRVDDRLLWEYVYTFPVEVYSVKNESAKTSFEATFGGEFLSEKQIDNLLEGERDSEEKSYSKEVELECEFDKASDYLGEDFDLDCQVKNLGNIVLRDLEVCLDGECEVVDLRINEQDLFSKVIIGREAGKQRVEVGAENDEVSKTILVEYEVLDKPEIKIDELIYPEAVEYEDKFLVEFVLKKSSYIEAEDVKVSLLQGNYPKVWEVEEFGTDRRFEVSFLGRDLKAGENEFTVLVEWRDKLGEDYSSREDFVIRLEGVSFGQRITLWFKSIGRFFEGLFS